MRSLLPLAWLRSADSATPALRKRQRLAGSLLLLMGSLTWLASCAPAEREGRLADLARWQDARLAPADSLIELLTGTDAHLRRAALRTAGLIGRSDVLPAMLDALDDPSLSVRREAAFSLGLLGNLSAVAALTRLLNDPHPTVREAAVMGLAHLEHDGAMLYSAALHDEPLVAKAAWTALRHAAGQADRDSLLAAIRTGLARPESAVRWRVLRCAELVPDSTLVAQIAPYVMDRDVDVRVHALRALARHTGPGALAAVLHSSERHARLRGRDLVRVRIAELRAIARLAGPFLAAAYEDDHSAPAGRAATVLSRGVTDPAPAVAVTALLASAQAVAALDLAPEAASRESLMPVWRLRLVRNVRTQLGDRSPAVRAAACRALGALRARGAMQELAERLTDSDASVSAAAFEALARLDPGHDEVCDWIKTMVEQHGTAGEAALLQGLPSLVKKLVEDDALQIPVTRFPRRQDPGCLPSLAWWTAARNLHSDDHALRAQAAPMLAELPGESSRRAIMDAWQVELARGDVAVQIALIKAMERLFAPAPQDHGKEHGRATEFTPRRQDCLFFAAAGQLAASDAADTLTEQSFEASGHTGQPVRVAAAEALIAAFDHRDLRVRLAAREAALATALLVDRLIPAAASLRETLPAHRRHPAQPAPAAQQTGKTRVRCFTDRGDFEIVLDSENAPYAVAAFLGLIESGFHEGLSFHRVDKDFVIQGGCPRGDGWGGPGWTLRCEYSPRPFERGTVGMAHAGKDSGGSQWFVCLSSQPHLDRRYTVFGEVTRGLDVIDRIERGDRYRLEIVAP